MPTEASTEAAIPLCPGVLCPEVSLLTGQVAAVPHLSSAEGSVIVLPKWLYIKDILGRYLTVRSGPVYATLTFRSGEPDPDCIFEAIEASALWYKFRGNTGGYIMRYYNDPGWYSTDGPAGSTPPSFNSITARGNSVYLKDSYGPPYYLSNGEGQSGAPLAAKYINESCRMEIIQAAQRNEINIIRYNIAGATIREAAPLVVYNAPIENECPVDVEQTIVYTYQKWAVGTWNNVAGRELGAKATVNIGVPFVTDPDRSISVTASSEHQWAGEEGIRQTVSSSAKITIPAERSGTVRVIVRNVEIEVPFTYRRRIEWTNGQKDDRMYNGIYRNIDSWKVDIELTLDDEEECPYPWLGAGGCGN